MQTLHAIKRSQQRGIPSLIQHWLLDYGEESFDGHGAIVRYFTPQSIRSLESDFGRTPVRRLSEYLRCYLVESSLDGVVITIGKRHNNTHVWRH
jgi:hypothetical protein